MECKVTGCTKERQQGLSLRCEEHYQQFLAAVRTADSAKLVVVKPT